MTQQISSSQSSRLARSFHVVAKPIGSSCNLDCTYCYYLHKQKLLPETAGGRFSADLLEEFVRQYIDGQDVDAVYFSWHGGEPTLLGLDFFQRAIRLQQKYAGDKHIQNDLQTNGVLLDDVWCSFFKEHNFLVGLSVDGPSHLHDRFRVSKEGEPSFDSVCRAARLLHQHQVPFNTLTVINSINVQHPDEVYQFLTQELGSRRLQWLPCMEPRNFKIHAPSGWDTAKMPIVGTTAAKPGHAASVVTDWSVDPNGWGEFLCRTFDLWYKNDLGRVVVNWFESLVGQWMGEPPQLCVLGELCGRSPVLESDGSIYSCDHFVYPEYRLGNLLDTNHRLANAVYSPRQRKFGCQKRDTLTDYCKQCEYRFACNGDCPRNRFIKTPDGQPGLSYLCPGIKRFLTYADPYLRQIVATLHQLGTIQSTA